MLPHPPARRGGGGGSATPSQGDIFSSSVHFVPTRREINAWIAEIMRTSGVGVEGAAPARPETISAPESHRACDVHHALVHRHVSSSSSSSSSSLGSSGAADSARAKEETYAQHRALAKLELRRQAVSKAEDTARALRVKLGSKAPPARLLPAVPAYSGGAAGTAAFSYAQCSSAHKALAERLRDVTQDLATLREKIRVLHARKQEARARHTRGEAPPPPQ